MPKPLYEQYRPSKLSDVLGQPSAIAKIDRLLARGWGCKSWWISGPSGAGKTTLARIIAAQGADDFYTEELVTV